jgi:3D (Asp-Asp-Asp) domain-containing protein
LNALQRITRRRSAFPPPLLTALIIIVFSTAIYPIAADWLRPAPQASPRLAGPSCRLRGAPPLTNPEQIWHLSDPGLVLPYDLVLAGYPESASGSHDLVARITCTAYTSRICETDSTPHITASNKRTRSGYLALSRDLLARYTSGAPFNYGDRIELIGLGTFQVEDTMARRWRRRADIWFPDVDAAYQWGRRSVLLAAFADESAAARKLADPLRLEIADRNGDVALLDTSHADDI